MICSPYFYRRLQFLSLDAYSRHKILVNEYILCHEKSFDKFKRDTSNDKTEIEVLHDNHRFLWDDEDDPVDTWEKRLARKYYDQLFKEYCICDLSRYKENKIAMRWRTEAEVVSGKGQFVCGSKHCDSRQDMRSWEVNFAYVERNEKKNALVKLRLCPECSAKLNYRQQRKEALAGKKQRHFSSDEEKHDNRQAGECSSNSISTREQNIRHPNDGDTEFDDYLTDLLP